MTDAPPTDASASIARVTLPGGGVVGLMHCPGRHAPLVEDVAAIAAGGFSHVVTLISMDEMETLGVQRLGLAVRAAGMEWAHLPIVDFGAPDAAWEAAWRVTGAELRAVLRGGGAVLVHCKGGCGRSGMVAARLLVEKGEAADAAIARVRAARPCAIETAQQEAAVRAARPMR